MESKGKARITPISIRLKKWLVKDDSPKEIKELKHCILNKIPISGQFHDFCVKKISEIL